MKNKLLISLLPFETERLIIRKISIDDVDMILKMDKQEETQKYLGGIKNKTREERIDFIKKYDNDVVGQLTVCLKDKTPIGLIGLKINEEDNQGEVSYIFDYDYWNNGYCTEACQKLLDACFKNLNIKAINADTVEGNIGSKRVLEKLGFNYQDSFVKDSTTFLFYKINYKFDNIN